MNVSYFEVTNIDNQRVVKNIFSNFFAFGVLRIITYLCSVM